MYCIYARCSTHLSKRIYIYPNEIMTDDSFDSITKLKIKSKIVLQYVKSTQKSKSDTGTTRSPPSLPRELRRAAKSETGLYRFRPNLWEFVSS